MGLFTLPKSSWLDRYYGPLAERLAGYEGSGDDVTKAVVEMVHREIDVYRKFSRWYGYVFFILRMRS